MQSIKQKVIAGAAWMLAIKWVSRLLGLANTMVLARLLTPVDFGIVAIAMGLIGIIDAFFDFGFDLALIKNKQATREDYDVVWSLRFMNMLIFGTLVAVSSPWVASYSSAPEVITVCLVLALSIVARGLSNVGTIDFQKELDFSKLFKFTFFPRLLSIITTIVLAVVFRTYWAIVLGTLLSSLYTVAFSYVMSPFRPRFRFRGSQHVWSFSRWVLITNMSRQLFNAMDKFLLSGLVSKAQLGFYNIAGNLSSIVTVELLAPVGAALMPGFAKLQNEQERLRNAFHQSMTVLFALNIPAAIGVWLVAPELVRVILGSQWGSATGFVGMFAFVFMFFSLSGTLSDFMAMVGLFNRTAIISLIRTLLFLAGFYFFYQAGGLEGVILLKIMLGCVEVLFLFEVSRRHVSLSVATLPQIIWRPLTSSLVMIYVMQHLPLAGTNASLLLLLIKVGAGGLTYVAISLLLWRLSGKPTGLESLALDLILSKLKPAQRGSP